jgi:hypothetical protein
MYSTRIHKSPTEVNRSQGFTKKCRLSWPTNNALVFEPKCGGGGGGCGVSANEYSCAHGARMKLKLEIYNGLAGHLCDVLKGKGLRRHFLLNFLYP